MLAICPQSTALRRFVVLLALSRQLSSTMFAMTFSDTPCTSRRSLTLFHIRRTRSESGSPLRTFYLMAPERSARTSGTVATMLPTGADILRASVDDSPNPLAPVDRLACACWWGSNVNRLVGHPSSKSDNFSFVPGMSSRLSNTYIALLSAFWHAGRDNSWSITRSMYAVRWTMEPVEIRLADCFSGMRQHHREMFCSPFLTISIVLSIAYVSVPMSTPTTFTPPRPAMRTSMP